LFQGAVLQVFLSADDTDNADFDSVDFQLADFI